MHFIDIHNKPKQPPFQVNLGTQLLNDVLQDIQNVRLVCESKRKQTNRDRELISDLAKGILPQDWNHYTVPAGVTVIQWVSDFSERIKQLQAISTAAASGGAAALKVGIGDVQDVQKVWFQIDQSLKCLNFLIIIFF